jgi:uncharacterized protein YjiS (DUF1127 family)
MTTLMSGALAERVPARSAWSAPARLLIARLWSTLCREWQTRRAIVRLEALDDYMLKDIGIHRSQIQSVVKHGNPHQHI